MGGYGVERKILGISLPISSNKRNYHEEQCDINHEGNQGWYKQSLNIGSQKWQLDDKGTWRQTFTKSKGEPMVL